MVKKIIDPLNSNSTYEIDVYSIPIGKQIMRIEGIQEFQTELAGGAKKRKGAKKSLNPYIKFVKKHFQSMKKKNPNDTAPQIMKKIAVEYNKQK